jgi:hypothetical protein
MEGIPLPFIDFREEVERPALTRISSSCLKPKTITIRTSRSCPAYLALGPLLFSPCQTLLSIDNSLDETTAFTIIRRRLFTKPVEWAAPPGSGNLAEPLLVPSLGEL